MKVLHLSRLGFFVTLIVGGLMGFASTAFDISDTVRFYVKPVAVMRGDIVNRSIEGEITLHIYGDKLRGEECEYLGVQAFGDRVVGLPIDLYIERTDMRAEGKTKPRGAYDIGLWRVWPTSGITRVSVFVTHDCQGTMRATKITQVDV